jgi:alpha-glucoside transport system substrate-binding protein
MFPVGEGDFNWDSYQAYSDSAPDLSGQSVTIAGPWLSPEADRFDILLTYFEGRDRRRGDLHRLRQLRAADRHRRRGRLGPQHRRLPAARPRRRHGSARSSDAAGRRHGRVGQRKLRRGSVLGRSGHLCRRRWRQDQFYGFFYNVDVKSLVWYVPENFEDAGYEVPETMEDLKALTEQIVADGETPWCIGLGSGGATGWPATDWVEDIMLRTQTPDVYDSGSPTRSRSTTRACRERDRGPSAGSRATTIGCRAVPAPSPPPTSATAPSGLFASPPQCYMHRQASFIPAFFPEGTEVGEDADFFYFPAFAGEGPRQPGSRRRHADGDHRRPGTMAFIEFLQTPDRP